VCIVSVVEDEIDWARLAAHKGDCKLVALLSDDHWRRELGLAVAAHCDYVLCNAPDAGFVYKEKALPWQWGYRASLYPDGDSDRIHEVAFLGQKIADRERAVDMLREGGIRPYVRGMGFGETITGAEIPYVLQRAQIGINMSKASKGGQRQIKARPFEVAGAGAVLLCEYAPGFEALFMDGQEAVFFQTLEEMVQKAKELLKSPKMTAKIAQAGQERAKTDHMYAGRWVAAFEAMGAARTAPSGKKRRTWKTRTDEEIEA
jgi:hypothetical protein